jgi:hypothetical protein
VARNSVGSAQIKNGAVKAVDVRDDGLTGADIDESTLRLPPVPAPASLPAVFAGPTSEDVVELDGHNFVDVASFTYTAPADGYVLAHAAASLNARGTSGLLWCLLTHDTTDAAAVYWDAGDVDGVPGLSPAPDLRQTVEGVVAVTKGQHTVTLSLRELQPGESRSDVVVGHARAGDRGAFPTGSVASP